jgi:FkbM family methyltransferase
MLIALDYLVDKYNLNITGIIHVGAHECEELPYYERYIPRENILWIEALPDKVQFCKQKYNDLLIENAVVSDKVEEVQFHVANNGQSSSIFELGTHAQHHPYVWYVNQFPVVTTTLRDILCKYAIPYNFVLLDIQGAELKALKGMSEYLSRIDYIYAEVNSEHVYRDCSLVTELDEYLANFGFKRVETKWCENYNWGDALYIKN